jgi:hypothetical protein
MSLAVHFTKDVGSRFGQRVSGQQIVRRRDSSVDKLVGGGPGVRDLPGKRVRQSERGNLRANFFCNF